MAPGNTVSDYGAPSTRSSKILRPLILANHALHWISSIIVMSIAAYFIAHYRHNTHLRYWISVVCPFILVFKTPQTLIIHCRLLLMRSSTFPRWLFPSLSPTRATSPHSPGYSPTSGSQPSSSPRRTIILTIVR